MSKNAKQYAQEMLKTSTSTEGRKEVVNACLFVLKALSEHENISSRDFKNISGGNVTLICPIA